MEEESINQGTAICFLCKAFILPQEDAFYHGAPFHITCLNNLGNGWMETLDPNPIPFFTWLLAHWNGLVEYVLVNGQFHIHEIPDWLLDSSFNEVIDDSEWENTESDAETDVLETVSEEGDEEVIVISDDEGDATEVDADGETEESETERTEGEDGEDA